LLRNPTLATGNRLRRRRRCGTPRTRGSGAGGPVPAERAGLRARPARETSGRIRGRAASESARAWARGDGTPRCSGPPHALTHTHTPIPLSPHGTPLPHQSSSFSPVTDRVIAPPLPAVHLSGPKRASPWRPRTQRGGGVGRRDAPTPSRTVEWERDDSARPADWIAASLIAASLVRPAGEATQCG
jgi:hypothetical protein